METKNSNANRNDYQYHLISKLSMIKFHYNSSFLLRKNFVRRYN